MKKVVLFSFLAAFSVIGISSCQPYEDGPSISFRSKEERVVNSWKVKYAFEDEKDISLRYKDIEYHLDYEGLLEIHTAVDSDSVAIQKGFWDMYDKGESIRFDYTDPAVFPDRNHYQILRLTEKEMWVWDLDDTLGLEIRFEPSAE